ncbi:MAG: tetratricopeptide repeat protein [candidate division Zixibacteria bacterium]|jgi:Ca-activated chloride channel family protein|nr:tetratricopeptide repeat protein [candidate division Zixibacteria bacterium]
MHRTTIWILCAAAVAASSPAFARKPVEPVRKGNEAFVNKDYRTALEQYSIAETELPESPELDYNIGNVQYQQGDYQAALERYDKAIKTDDVLQQARAHYNSGNAHFKAQDYPKAIESYKKALEVAPDDMDAKFNLELARRLLKEQTQPEQQQQNEQQQQQQQQEKQQQQQPQPQQDQQDKQQDEQQQQPEQAQDKPMSKEDAERILNALEDDEQDVQKKVRRNVKASSYLGKDW